MKIAVLASLLLLAFLNLCPAQQPDKVIVYKEPEGAPLKLHCFLPDGWKADDKRPTAVFFFGGGWKTGTPRQFYRQCQLLADKGMVAISAQYRTSESHGTDPRACVEDGKSAVRWLHQHAKELGIDVDRLALGGGSAGGHVAAAAHFCKGFDAEGEDPKVPTTADALLLYNPVLDNGPGQWGHNKVKKYWEQISPAHNVFKLDPPSQPVPVPPILYMLGTKDRLISVDTAKRFQKTVEEAGGRIELKLHEGADHGWFNHKEGLKNTNEELVEFLASLGWIKE
ncbi:MAG: alpha/beta hydrolase fold domain-containing protein [Akkermansiaceae bacterium]|nr:alpha/beta hydrolase fold domain-containing protein [Akkermansiaceae bacterium]